MQLPASVEGVVEVKHFAAGGKRWLFIEVPHGATRERDYWLVAHRMKSKLPHELEHFFFVNTDTGAPEGAEWLGQELSRAGIDVVVARCLIPRTFIDCNRVLGATTPGVVQHGLTPAVASYIDAPADIAWLDAQHRGYHALVGALYRGLCGEAGGRALQLHSYAPRSVQIEKTDANIVEALHEAYQPANYAKWAERPPVDLICATADGSFRAAPALNDLLVAEYAAAGIQVGVNATYHLHPITAGMAYAQQFPDRVLCIELNRGLLSDPFVPFAPNKISAAAVARLLGPAARVLAR